MADPSGGNANAVVEDVVLNLVSNFESKLKYDLSRYATFEKKIGGVSRSMEKSVNVAYKQVSDNLSGMVSQAQSSILSSVNATRGAMRTIQNEGNKIHQMQMQSINRLQNAQTEMLKIFYSDASTKGKETAITKIVQKMENDVIKTTSSINLEMGKLASSASSNIARSAKNSVDSIRKSIYGITAEVQQARKNLGANATVAGVQAGGKTAGSFKDQLKVSEKAVKDNARLVIEAERQMEAARVALAGQANAKLAELNQKHYVKSIENLQKVRKAYQTSEMEVSTAQKSLRRFEVELQKSAGALKQKIKIGIDENSLKNQYNLVLQNLRTSSVLAAKGLSSDFSRSVAAGAELRSVLSGSIQEIRNMLSVSKELHATGLIDTSKEQAALNKILGGFEVFKNEFKEVKAAATNILPVENIREKATVLEKTLKDLQNRMKMLATEGMPTITSKSNLFDVKTAQDRIAKIEALQASFVTKKEQAEKQISAIEREAHKVRLRMINEENKEVRAQLNEYQVLLENNARELRNSIVKMPMPDLSKVKGNIRASAEAILVDINRTFGKVKFPDTIKDNFRNQFSALQTEFNKISKRKIISNTTVADFKNKTNNMINSVEELRLNIMNLQNDIKRLSDLNKRGLAGPDAGVQLENMRNVNNQLKSFMNEIERDSRRAQQNITNIGNQASKSLFKTGWEAVRNFRWQIAAVLYLANQAVRFVKRLFLGVLDEIQQFRKDAMSIASSMLFSMLGETSKAYKNAYAYSRQLMQQMERQAAKTILTLEDMTMLVKTFTQAGMIPDVNKDLGKIATIGTAIKLLTEGMANAGVQMRQELYAVILGRQRATDQLAMMFKMVGVNIQDIIKKSKMEGKNMIDVLSEELKPFAELNKVLENEYATQINQLDVIFKKIKRVGSEPTLEKFALDIKVLNETLMDNTGNLTEAGKSWAYIAGNITESIRLLISGVSKMFLSFRDGKKYLTGISDTFVMINYVIAVMTSAVDILTTELGNTKRLLFGIGNILSGDFSKGFDKISSIPREVFDSFYRLGDRIDEVNESQKALNDSIQKIQDASTDLENIFSVPNKEVFDGISNFYSKVEEAKKAALAEGPEKIELEYQLKLDDNDSLKQQIKQNMDYIVKQYTSYLAKGNEFTEQELKTIRQSFSAYMEIMEEVTDYEKSILDRRNRELAEFNDKQAKELARQQAEYENLLETLSGKSLSRIDEVSKKYKQLKIDISEIIVTNKVAADKKDFLNSLLETFKKNEIAKAVKETRDEFDAFMERIKSVDALDPFEKINNEVNKLTLEVKQNINYTKEQQRIALDTLEIYRQRRIEEEKDKQAENIAKINKKYDEFLLKLQDTDESPIEKLRQKYAELRIELEGLISKYDVFKGNAENLRFGLVEAEQREFENVVKTAINEYNKFIERASSHKIKNPFEEVQNEFSRLENQVNTSTLLKDFPAIKGMLLEQVKVFKEERIEFEKINELANRQKELFASLSVYADYLSESLSPRDNKLSEQIRLTIQYKEAMNDLKLALRSYQMEYANNPEILEQYEKTIKEHMANLELLYGKHMRDVQEPFWNKLKDLSSEWLDGFADALAEATVEFDNFGNNLAQSVADLSKNIQKQMLKEAYQQWLINPMKNMIFGSGEGAQPQGVAALGLGGGGGGEKAAAPAAKGISTVIGDAIIGVWDKTSTAISTGFTSMFGYLQTGFGGLMDGIMGLFGSFGGGGGTNYAYNGAGGASGLIGSLLPMVSSIAGGIGSTGSDVGTGGSFNLTGSTPPSAVDLSNYSLMNSNFDFQMANGGRITEPVVGLGMRSNKSYLLGENGVEDVVPEGKLKNTPSNLSVSVPINIQGNGSTNQNKLISELRTEIEALVVAKIKQFS